MEKIEDKSNWERVKDVAKASIFSTLLAFASPGGASAGEKANDFRDAVRQPTMSDMRDSIADYKTMTEQLKKDILNKQIQIKERAAREGKAINFNGEQVRQIVTQNGDVILIGENFFEDKMWMSLTTPSKLTYLDSDGDGMLDAAFIDQEEGKVNAEEFSDNISKARLDIDMAAVMAGTYFRQMNKQKFHFLKENGNYVIDGLDMKTGKRLTLEGSKADQMVRDISAFYLDHLNSIN